MAVFSGIFIARVFGAFQHIEQRGAVPALDRLSGLLQVTGKVGQIGQQGGPV